MEVLSVIGAIVTLGVFGLLLAAVLMPEPQFEPMSYEDEMDWLMNEHGLSREEADEIASLPWRY